MKHRLHQLFSNDSGKIVLLALLVLFLAFGGVQLNKLVSRNMLRADAVSTVSAWADNLVTNTDDMPAVITGSSPSARTDHLLRDATEVGDIYRYRIIDRTGHTVFSSVRPGLTAMSATDIDTNQILQSVLSGTTQSEIGFGKSSENPPYFALCYVPLRKNGQTLGMIEVYIDQTEDHAIYQRSLLLTESIVAFMVLLAGGIPGFVVYRKMRDHRRAEAKALVLAEHNFRTSQANRELERANRDKDEKLAHLLEHSPAVLYSLTIEGGRAFPQMASENIASLLGFSVDETQTSEWWVTHLHPDDREREIEGIQETIKKGVRTAEYRIKHKNGEYSWVEDTRRVIFDGEGKPTEIIGVWTDITQRKAVEIRMTAIVESSEDAIIAKNTEGIVTTWNRSAERIFGYTAVEMIGQPILRLLPSDRSDEETTILARLRQGEVVEHFETIRVRKDGTHINVSLTISPIRDANGNVIGASKIARDITDRRKLQHQLQQSQKMDAVGQLTGGVAHDFNNLLGIIIGNLDLLEREIGDNQVASQRVQVAQKAALRGSELTRRLLAFSSHENLSPSPNKLHHLIRNILEMTQRVIGPEIRIATNFDKAISKVVIDAAGFESALVNLMVNARDAMPKGGSITIATHLRQLNADYPPVRAGELKAGLYACVSVSDTGEGMSKQTLERVFEPFFTTKPRGKGTGLGLAMVYGFVKQSNGTVRIYSEPGFGTTVNLYLPATEESVPEHVEVPQSTASFEGAATVLVVDDELDLLEIATAYLTEMGCKSYAAVDARNALQVLQKHSDINLLLTDIVMPGGMNGVELAHKVRQLNPSIKVIYCSGFPADSLAERSMPLVDGPLLRKPYQRDEFSALVRRVMQTEISGAP
jgi:PAS domain S-box-containing protein